MSTLKVSTISPLGTDATKTITVGSTSNGDVVAGAGANTPAFQVCLSSDQTFSDVSTTKINFDSVQKDTNSGFNTTDKRFVVPVAGSYFVSSRTKFIEQSNKIEQIVTYIYKNGSAYLANSWRGTNAEEKMLTPMLTGIICDCVVGDYFEVYAYVNAFGGSNSTTLQDELENCSFEGHKLIGV